MNERIFAIAHYVDQGVLYLLLSLCFVSLYMILDRAIYLRKMVKQSKKINRAILQSLNDHNYKTVESLCRDVNHQGLEVKAISLSLDHYKKFKTSGVEEIFKTVTQFEKHKLEKYLGFLATVGSNGPYIGLFGTVLGIMKAFNDMGAGPEGGSGASIMAGISSALIATAAGLMVAIPAVLAFNYFNRQVKNILNDLESCKQFCFLYEKTIEE